MDKVELIKAFTALATMQDTLNAKVNVSWRHANYPFWRAIWTEVGEATGYVQWAWWKALGPKTIVSRNAQLQFNLEMADVLHFGISQMLQDQATHPEGTAKGEDDLAVAATQLADAYLYALERITPHQVGLMPLLEDVAIHALIDHGFSAPYFFAASYTASLDVSALIAYYHGKNILNVFRQDHGYKTGHYIKNWGTAQAPLEDNVALAEMIEEFRSKVGERALLSHINSGAFVVYLRGNLYRAYAEVQDNAHV